MARPFRLAGLMRLRNLQEEQAAAELARANAERRAAAKRRQETQNLLAGTTLPQEGGELVWQAAIASRAALTGLVGEASATLERAGLRADAATAEWSGARTRATTLEKLSDRHTLVVRAEEERAEQLVLDEAAARGRTTAGVDDSHPTTPGTSPTFEEER